MIRIRIAGRHDWIDRNVWGVRVLVADDGVGIPPSAWPKLFEPFFSTKGQLGTGLGLWISKEIVEHHRGSLRIRSSMGQAHRGTTVSIFLPAKGIE